MHIPRQTLFTVLRTGGEYTHEHVAAFSRNLRRVDGDAFVVCLTNEMPPDGFGDLVMWGTPPAETYWPSWWMKMVIFHPELLGDIVYCDLDTVFVNHLDDIFEVEGDVVLRDFYRGGALDRKPRAGFGTPTMKDIGSGFMRWTEATRRKIWQEWIAAPEFWMEYGGRHGDQKAIQGICEKNGIQPKFWQDVLPGKIVSFKADVVNTLERTPPRDSAVVCFHGRPRPWQVDKSWDWVHAYRA